VGPSPSPKFTVAAFSGDTTVKGHLSVQGTTDLSSVDVSNDASIGGSLTVTGTINRRRLTSAPAPTTITISSGQISIQNDGQETFAVDSAGQVTATSMVTGTLNAQVIQGSVKTDGTVQAGSITAGQIAIGTLGLLAFSVNPAGKVTAKSVDTIGTVTAGQLAIGTDTSNNPFMVFEDGSVEAPVANIGTIVAGVVLIETRKRMLVSTTPISPIQVFNNGTAPTFEVKADGSVSTAASVTLTEAGVKSNQTNTNTAPDNSACTSTANGLLAVNGQGKLYVCSGTVWVLV